MSNPLPREIAPGCFWLGECMEITFQGRRIHAYNSVYLLVGEDCSMLVEAGHPQSLQVVENQLEALLATGIPEPRYLFVTHTETPHAAGDRGSGVDKPT